MSIKYKVISMNRIFKQNSKKCFPRKWSDYNKLMEEKKNLSKHDNSSLKMYLYLDSVLNFYVDETYKHVLPVDIIDILKKYLNILDVVNKDLLEWCQLVENIRFKSFDSEITQPISELSLSLKMKEEELCVDFKFMTSFDSKLRSKIFKILYKHNKEKCSTIISKSKLLPGLSNINNNSKENYDKSKIKIRCINSTKLHHYGYQASVRGTEISALVCLDIINALIFFTQEKIDVVIKGDFLSFNNEDYSFFYEKVYNICRFFNVSESLSKNLFNFYPSCYGIKKISNEIKKNIEQKYKDFVFLSTSLDSSNHNIDKEKSNGTLLFIKFESIIDNRYMLTLGKYAENKISHISEDEKKYSFKNTILDSAEMTRVKECNQSSFHINFLDLVFIMGNIHKNREAFAL
ncbi:MAG: hypothetical protein GY730_09250 [bacterium]|nr:hypothetical protein [bacterium]